MLWRLQQINKTPYCGGMVKYRYIMKDLIVQLLHMHSNIRPHWHRLLHKGDETTYLKHSSTSSRYVLDAQVRNARQWALQRVGQLLFLRRAVALEGAASAARLAPAGAGNRTRLDTKQTSWIYLPTNESSFWAKYSPIGFLLVLKHE